MKNISNFGIVYSANEYFNEYQNRYEYICDDKEVFMYPDFIGYANNDLHVKIYKDDTEYNVIHSDYFDVWTIRETSVKSYDVRAVIGQILSEAEFGIFVSTVKACRCYNSSIDLSTIERSNAFNLDTDEPRYKVMNNYRRYSDLEAIVGPLKYLYTIDNDIDVYDNDTYGRFCLSSTEGLTFVFMENQQKYKKTYDYILNRNNIRSMSFNVEYLR